MSLERIDKILSHEGFGSRKEIRKLLKISEVTVNGVRISDAGFQINPDKDIISVDDEEIFLSKNVYLMMNKPKDHVSANKDGVHSTVFDLLEDKYHTPYFEENLHLIGRLDIDTEGLLVFTTDGGLIHRITSPKTHSPKSYFVGLRDSVLQDSQKKIAEDFKNGIEVPAERNESGFIAKPAEIEWKSEKECVLTISEGKYHQVKRMLAAEGNEVVYLKRLSIGNLKLDESLELGQYRNLTDEEVSSLLSF